MNERKSCLRTQKCKSYEKAKKHNNRSYRPEYSLPKELAQENISKHWVVNGKKMDAKQIYDDFIQNTKHIRTAGAMNLSSPREEPVVIEKIKPEPKIDNGIDYDKIFQDNGINTRPYKIKDEKITESSLKSVISERNFNKLCDEFSKTNANENDKKAVEKLRDSVYPKKAEYTIQRGENLSYIARKFNTSVDNLLRENPQIQDKNLIYAGSKINLPQGIEIESKPKEKMNVMSPTSEIQQSHKPIKDKAIDEPKQTRKLTDKEKEQMLKEFVEKKSSKSYRASINRLFGVSGDGINRELMLQNKYNIYGLEEYRKQLDEMEKEIEKVDTNIDVMGF